MFKLDFSDAAKRIKQFIRKTPLEYSHALSKEKNAEIYLKLENLQVSGSFKARGAFNRMLTLSDEERKRGVIASTAGNHGVALALAAQSFNVPARIYVPRGIDPFKLKLLQRYQPEIEYFASVEDARETALKEAQQAGLTFVSAYNNPFMIEGGGTIALEILADLPSIDYLIVGVGGGGLASGLATVLKEKNPQIRICSVQAENSPLMSHWLKQGKPDAIPLKPTLAEGLAVNMELDTITFPILQKLVDEQWLVTEREIERAMAWMFHEHQMVIEGAAAATIAAVQKRSFPPNSKVAVILTGQNVSHEKWLKAVRED